jgi:hypothetical protein
LDQLWPHLPAERQQKIGTVLAQMIAKQMATATQFASPTTEVQHE